MPTEHIATDIEIARIASPYSDRRYFVHIGRRLQDIDFALYQAGEPVSFPPQVYTTTTLNQFSSSVVLSGAYTLATSGVVCFQPGTTNAGWFQFNGRTDFTLLGLQFLYGNPNHPAFTNVSDFSPLPAQNIIGKPTMREVNNNGILTWEVSLTGRFYNANLMPPDRSVLIEEMVMPHSGVGAWSPRSVWCHGFVRDWDLPKVDKNRELRWSATVVSLITYLNDAPTTAKTFGTVDLAKGKSVTASPNLTTPEFELDEWAGGSIGTTAANNVTGDQLGDPYISEIAPTITPEIPSSNPVSDFLIDEVYALGPNGAPADLQYIMLRLPPGSPFYNETGVALQGTTGGYYLATRQSVFVPHPFDGVNGVVWSPIVIGNYIRLPAITLTSNSPRLCLCRDRQILEQWFQTNGNDEMQIVEWAELPGFGEDQFPARNIVLRPAGDRISLRFKGDRQDEYVRDYVAWGDNVVFWEGASDSTNSNTQWDDNNTAPAITAGKSIRRKPTCLDTNTAADWEVEDLPVPTDDRAETDSVFVSLDLEEWVVTTAQAMTALSPADGGNLILDDATWLHDCGEIQISGGERVFYHSRDDNTLYNIKRGASGTTPAIHTLGASVKQINRHAVLNQGMTSTVPGVGQVLKVKFGQYLRQASPDNPQTVTIESEDVKYTYRQHDYIVVSQRGANATTPVSHSTGYLLKQYDPRGAHAQPLVSKIQVVRKPVLFEVASGRFEYVALTYWEWWQSIETAPRYPEEDPDWELDWVGENYRLLYQTHWSNTPMVEELDMGYPENLRHVLVNARRMSDEGFPGRLGRVKINLIRVPRYHSATIPQHPNNEGAGGPLLAMLGQKMDINLVTIEPGTFNYTSANITFPDSTVGEILRDYIKFYGLIVDCERDGRLRIYKDPFFPASPIPPIACVFTRSMYRDFYATNFPSRASIGQVVVKITNPETEAVYEGRYPPMEGYGGVEPYEIISTVGSKAMATTIAQGFYRRHPLMARKFEFTTVGIAEWLRPNMRVLVEDIADGLSREPKLVDCIVETVTQSEPPQNVTRFTCREMRFI